MPKLRRFALATLAMCLALAPVRGFADDAAPPAGLKGDVLMWMKDAESKLTQLADAMPEGKYSWRPAKGVRSAGEVYMHVATANLGIPSFFGVQPPAGFDFKTYEKSLTRKADIQKALKDSFAHVEQAWMDTPDSELDAQVELFGMKMTKRAAYLLILSHMHEHLGQSIAYARSCGVTPPWTAAQNAKVSDEKAKAGGGDKK
jgi:uncharacterized damage-inducible protein DinB